MQQEKHCRCKRFRCKEVRPLSQIMLTKYTVFHKHMSKTNIFLSVKRLHMWYKAACYEASIHFPGLFVDFQLVINTDSNFLYLNFSGSPYLWP